MSNYASLRKKHSASRTIAVIMALLVVIEMCSLTVLFSRIIGYSGDNKGYVISLTEGADKSKLSKIDTASTGFIIPTYVADPDVHFIEPGDQVNVKDIGFKTYDEDQAWSTDTNIEVFHLKYDEGKDEFTVISSDSDKIFAPGTGDTYKFSVSNTSVYDLKYLVYLEAWINAKDENGDDLWIPLNSRFYNSDGNYFGADGTSDWHEYEYIDKTGEIRPLAKGGSRDYFVDWEWPFERFDGEGLAANDAYDTMLGRLAYDGSDLVANIRIKTVAWIEDFWHIYTDVAEGKGTTDEDPDMVEQGEDETSTITATPAEGYVFDHWTFDDEDVFDILNDGKLTDPTLTILPGSDIHAHAHFKPAPTEPEPTLEPTQPTESKPTEPKPTEPKPTEPKPTEPKPTEPEPTVIPTQEPTVAYWTVDADVTEGKGSVTPTVDAPVKVEQGSGDTVTITATPDDGYVFDGWVIDGDYTLPEGGTLSDPTLVIKPDSDIHAHAKFVPVPKYWTIDADVIEGEGTVTPSVEAPVKVEQGKGDTVTITATPEDGYVFDGWVIDGDYTLPEGGSLDDPNLIIKPESDIHAHAKFKKVEPTPDYWTVYADITEGEGTVAPTQENPVKVVQGDGEKVTITATPAEGYQFAGWVIDGEYTLPDGGSLDDMTIVIQPGSDIVAHAKFIKVETPTEEPTAPVVTPTSTPATTVVAPTQAPTTAVTVKPQTGDPTHNLLWIVLAISAFVALVVLFFVYRKVRKREKAEG